MKMPALRVTTNVSRPHVASRQALLRGDGVKKVIYVVVSGCV